MIRLREILAEAGVFVSRMPKAQAGLLFLEGDKIVQPDPVRLGEYQTHEGQRRGHWPGNSEITSAMLERGRDAD